jgi:signal transduction histidine kinase
MRDLTAVLKRHTLWGGALLVLIPLLVLLLLQYRWLGRLERVTAMAHKAALSNYLEAVGTEVRYFYLASAERALNLPAAMFASQRFETAAAQWQKRPVEGARRLFLVDFSQEHFGHFMVFNPATGKLDLAPASNESLAMIMAMAPWQLRRYRDGNGAAEPGGLRVDERDAENRIIVNPVTDDSSRVVGAAGMILDEDYFRDELLPAAVHKAMSSYFEGLSREEPSVTVRDGKKAVVFTTRRRGDEGDAVVRNLPFVFADWTIAIHSGASSPEQWARANFYFNMGLSILLAVVVAGGIGLALRAADRAIRLSAMKSDFVSNVSHELRTPLASIRVFAEFLRLGRAQAPERVQEYGEYIESESRRLSRLIDNILDFSRIESGRKTYEFHPGDLRPVVQSVVRSFEVRLRHDGFELALALPDGPLPPVRLDADAMAQAIGNLVDNAVKYSGPSRRIGVRLFRDGGEMVVAVQDEGIGIAGHEQRKIFERFHRVGSSLVHDVKGSGLGLSIVRHIVSAHGGEVTVESEPERGSTFAIRLPIDRTAEMQAAAAPPAPSPTRATGRADTEAAPGAPETGRS